MKALYKEYPETDVYFYASLRLMEEEKDDPETFLDAMRDLYRQRQQRHSTTTKSLIDSILADEI